MTKTAESSAPQTPAENARYARHLRLPGFGAEGQARLARASVLVVGLGGLGSPLTLYLAAAGVGRLVVSDFDQVEISNLQRQILYSSEDTGRTKVEAASTRLAKLNPEVAIEPLGWALDEDELRDAVATVDCVADCSDNFETRFALNAACVAAAIPLVSAAAIGFTGQLSLFDNAGPESPCYRCLFDEGDLINDPGEPCALEGVFAPLLGVLGSAQAGEILKMLSGCAPAAFGRLLRYDARSSTWKSSRVRRDPGCPAGHREAPRSMT